MLRKKTQGFTLIELMVVIVIIGVLASLAIPRFTEASDRAKVAEAPRILASYEGAMLAARAELGNNEGEDIAVKDIVFTQPLDSRWFLYTFDEPADPDADPALDDEDTPATSFYATTRSKIGKLAAGDHYFSKFIEGDPDGSDEEKEDRFAKCFDGSASYTEARRFVPNYLDRTPNPDCQ